MSKHVILILIACALGGGIVAVIGYYVIRFMRGSIMLFLPCTIFDSGAAITGSFDLHAKKEIQGNRLIVSLIGVQVARTYDGGKTQTRSQEIYRDEVLIEGAKTYPAGYTAKHDFTLATPNMNSSDFMNSTLGQSIATVLSLLSNRDTSLKWKVEARLDAAGVDLAAAKTVSIKMR